MKKISDEFLQIKKKHLLWAIVKSAVCGISLGLFATGILMLALKLSAIEFATLYYVLVGVGTALVGGVALFFLLFRPTDKKVAKITDDDFGLNERVQTAIAYSEYSGTLVELQRQDAEEKIKTLPARKFSLAKIWQFIVVALVALAIGAAGIFVPAKASTGEEFIDPDSTPRVVTELERAGVRELIANIDASSLSEELKTSVGQALNKLLTDLDTVNTEGTLRHAVETATEKTDATLAPTLSYLKIGAALTDADQVYLGQAVTNGGNVFKYYMLTTYDETRIFDGIKYDASNAKVVKGVTSLRNDLTLNVSDGLSSKLSETVSGVSSALAAAAVSKEDALYVLLASFADRLSAIKSNADKGSSDTDIQNSIGELNTAFIVNLTYEVSTQAYNAAINVFVSNRLKTIFGYLPLELPIVDPDKSNGSSDTPDPGGKDPSDPDQHPPGGDGPGGMEYGSDDEVWVPGKGYMKYGDVIDEYYDLINQYLHSDELTEEQKNMIRAYYEILFGSNKNK